MSRTAITSQTIALTGLEPAYSEANADGHSFTPGSNVFLHVKNDGMASVNVTADCIAKVRGQAVSDVVVAVPAGEDRMIGPFYADLFAQPSTGLVHVDFSGVTDVTLALLTI